MGSYNTRRNVSLLGSCQILCILRPRNRQRRFPGQHHLSIAERNKAGSSKYKTILFSLFPTNMVKEDTLRLLLIMALMDNIFNEGITSWSDLMKVESSVTGRLIPIRRDFLHHPVLRKIHSRKHQLTVIAEHLPICSL
jgi:hypothetical protein